MRICLLGAAGVGKSTLSAELFSKLKKKQHKIELVHEVIKSWAYLGRKATSFDSVYIFGRQLHREDLPLQCGVYHIITDSPLLLSPIYAKLQNSPVWGDLLNLCKAFDKKYPSINLFLERKVDYKKEGRYETEEEALMMDEFMLNFLAENNIEYTQVNPLDVDGILNIIESNLK